MHTLPLRQARDRMRVPVLKARGFWWLHYPFAQRRRALPNKFLRNRTRKTAMRKNHITWPVAWVLECSNVLLRQFMKRQSLPRQLTDYNWCSRSAVRHSDRTVV